MVFFTFSSINLFSNDTSPYNTSDTETLLEMMLLRWKYMTQSGKRLGRDGVTEIFGVMAIYLPNVQNKCKTEFDKPEVIREN